MVTREGKIWHVRKGEMLRFTVDGQNLKEKFKHSSSRSGVLTPE
jgi:hypothetical protein